MSEWRKKLPVHPAADCLPMMSAVEIKALAADIKANGLLNKIDLVVQPQNEDDMLLDGRNRMEALELLGKKLFSPKGDLLPEFRGREIVIDDEDAIKHVTSANIARRHLTNEQKRATIAALLKANPEKSSRRIAKMVDASHVTVIKERKKLEGLGKIDRVENVEDTLGRKYPANQKSKKPDPSKKPAVEKPKTRSLSDAQAEKALALNGWFNRAAEAAELARYDDLAGVPKTKKYRALAADAAAAWAAVVKAVDKKN